MPQDNIIFLQSFKWAKPCSKCGKEIEENSQGYWDKNAKPYKYYHVSCYQKPSQQKQVRNNETDMALNATEEAMNKEMAIEGNVRSRLRTAKEIINDEFPEASQTSDYFNLIAEVCHQLFAEKSIQKIQAGKEKNIKAIR